MVKIGKFVKIPDPAPSLGFYRNSYFFREIIADLSFCGKYPEFRFMGYNIKIAVKYWWDEGIYYSLLN